MSRLTDDQMSRIRNQKIGFVFQSFNLIPDLDVFDNVDVPLRYRGLPARRAQGAHRAGAGAGRPLLARRATCPRSSRAASSSAWPSPACWPAIPRLILADEPTGNLDSLMTREIMDLLERINEQGTTIVMVTHSPECAARAQRQIHLLDGKVVDLDAAPDAGPRARLAGGELGGRPCSSTTSASPPEPAPQPRSSPR